MERIVSSLVLAILVVASATAVMGQTRIRFQKGRSSTTVIGNLSSKKVEQVYLIGARAGQRLTLRLSLIRPADPDFVNIDVGSPSDNSFAVGRREEVFLDLPQTGDYRIILTPPGSFYQERLRGFKRLQYRLFVEIR